MEPKFTYQDVKLVSFDGKLTWKARCPRCRAWGYIDDDQYHGLVSLQCGNSPCSFHETHDLSIIVTPMKEPKR